MDCFVAAPLAMTDGRRSQQLRSARDSVCMLNASAALGFARGAARHSALASSGRRQISGHRRPGASGPKSANADVGQSGWNVCLAPCDIGLTRPKLIRPSGKSACILPRSCPRSAKKSAARKLRFAERFQCDLGRPVLPAKIFRSPRRANQRHYFARLTADEGRIMIVTNVRWDAVDAECAKDERA